MNGQVMVKFQKQASGILNRVFWQTSSALRSRANEAAGELGMKMLRASSVKKAVKAARDAHVKASQQQKKYDEGLGKLRDQQREEERKMAERHEKERLQYDKKERPALDKAIDTDNKAQELLTDVGVELCGHDGKPKDHRYNYHYSCDKPRIELIDVLGIKQISDARINSEGHPCIKVTDDKSKEHRREADGQLGALSDRYQELKDLIMDKLQEMWSCPDKEDFTEKLDELNRLRQKLIQLHNEVTDEKLPDGAENPLPEL